MAIRKLRKALPKINLLIFEIHNITWAYGVLALNALFNRSLDCPMNQVTSLLNFRRLFSCSALLISLTAFADPITIDSFTNAFSTVSNGNLATSTLNYPGNAGPAQVGTITGASTASVIGGEMQAYIFDNSAYHTSSMQINPSAGTLSLYGPSGYPNNQLLQFGTAIAPANFSNGVLSNPPSLNLDLTTSDSLAVDILQVSPNSSHQFNVTFDTSYGNVNGSGIFSSAGNLTYTLGSLGLNAQQAANIDGFSINFSEAGSSAATGTILSGLEFDTAGTSAGVPDGGTTAALLGAGLIGLVALRRKFTRA